MHLKRTVSIPDPFLILSKNKATDFREISWKFILVKLDTVNIIWVKGWTFCFENRFLKYASDNNRVNFIIFLFSIF